MPPPPIVVRRSSSSGSGSGEGNNGSDDAPPSRRGLRRRRSLASDAADQGEAEAAEEEYEEPAPRRPRLPPPPPPPLPPLTTARAADLLALERLAAPLVLGACGEREIGVRVERVGVVTGGASQPPLLRVPSSDAVARCFCLMARMLRKVGGGDACEEANWRACTDPAVLALGMGPAFTTAERRVVGFGGGDDDATTAAPNTSQLVVWLDPDVCAAAADATDPGRARDLRCAAVAPGGPFWLFRGGGGGGERVRHGTMLVVPAAGDGGDRRVEASGSSARRGQQQPLGLVELRFYASESVLEACARLGGGAASVLAAMVVAG